MRILRSAGEPGRRSHLAEEPVAERVDREDPRAAEPLAHAAARRRRAGSAGTMRA